MMKFLIRIMLGLCALMCFITPALAVEFTWQDDGGKVHHLNEFKGKPLILHVWASWCFPCRGEMPLMVAWMKAHPDVTVLPVTLDESSANAVAFLQRNGLSLPVLQADASQLYTLGARGLPTTVVIDRDGEPVSVHSGVQAWQDAAWNDRVLPLFRVAN